MSQSVIAIRAVGTASAVILLCAGFVLAGFFISPNGIGQLVNPHSQVGARGLTTILGLSFASFLALLVAIPWALLSFARHPAVRSPLRWAVVGSGTAVALLFAAMFTAALLEGWR